MGWYVYGIMLDEQPTVPPIGVVGIDDAEVVLHGGGGLRAIISGLRRTVHDLQDATPEQILEAVRRHDQTLLTLSRTRPVLPVRFGTVLADRDAVDQLLEDRDGHFARTLAEVTGADEWVIRVGLEPAGNPLVQGHTEGLPPGHAFFAKRKAQAQACADARDRTVTAASEVHARLSGLARSFRSLPIRDPGTVARTAYLVDHELADPFVAAAESVVYVTVAVQGPLPPYRFVNQDAP